MVAIICPSHLTYARQRPITASHSSRHDMLAIISSRLQYGPFLFFCCRSYVKLLDYWRAEKNFSLLPEAPLRPEARGICHICHTVNPTLATLRYATEPRTAITLLIDYSTQIIDYNRLIKMTLSKNVESLCYKIGFTVNLHENFRRGLILDADYTWKDSAWGYLISHFYG